MNFVTIGGIGVVLLWLLWLAGRRRNQQDLSPNREVAADGELLVRLPPPALFGRCLSATDVEFVTTLQSRALLRFLLHERRRLALEWLRQTRREAGRLFRLHLGSVRHSPDLRPAAEAKLLLQVALFMVVYGILMGFVGLYGPFRTQGFVQSVHALAGVLSGLGGRIADSVVPGHLARVSQAARS
ncbi:MAG: hypothetical protein LAP40_28625 [Acidobacteriia bacterium]|nr:hypothetical protein [Terriglobia bacterium]